MQAVDAHRFPRVGGAGDEQVRHARQIGDARMAGDVASQREGERRLTFSTYLRLDDLTQVDDHRFLVRHLDADHAFARHRRLHAHIQRRQREGDVVRQVGNAVNADARRRYDFEARDTRAAFHPHHLGIDAEAAQHFLQHGNLFLGIILCLLGRFRRGVEQVGRRQLVWTGARWRHAFREGKLLGFSFEGTPVTRGAWSDESVTFTGGLGGTGIGCGSEAITATGSGVSTTAWRGGKKLSGLAVFFAGFSSGSGRFGGGSPLLLTR